MTFNAIGDGIPVCFVKNSTNDGCISVFTHIWKKNISQTVTQSIETGMTNTMRNRPRTLISYDLTDLTPQRMCNRHLTKWLDRKNAIINCQCGLMFQITCELLTGQGISQTLDKMGWP